MHSKSAAYQLLSSCTVFQYGNMASLVALFYLKEHSSHIKPEQCSYITLYKKVMLIHYNQLAIIISSSDSEKIKMASK